MAKPANPVPALAALLEAPTRFLFFTGKGGVGKTSLACATAIALADRGQNACCSSAPTRLRIWTRCSARNSTVRPHRFREQMGCEP